MMFEVEVSAPLRFEHYLEGFGERAREPHRHTWNVTVTLSTPELDERGVVLDFVKLRNQLGSLLEPFQDKLLNTLEPFDKIPATAERIALWVAGRMGALYPGMVSKVTVGTDEERARYSLT